MNFDQPQGATGSTKDDIQKKILEAQEAEKAKSVPTAESSPVVESGVIPKKPVSMEELLAGLQEETKEVKEPPKVAEVEVPVPKAPETVVAKSTEKIVPPELRAQMGGFKQRYADGHKQFGDKWFSTQEFLNVGVEYRAFIAGLGAQGFTMEKGEVVPIDVEKLERERQTNEIKEQMTEIGNTNDMESGKMAYAILRDDVAGFSNATILKHTNELKFDELSLKRLELELAGMTEEQFRESRNTSSTKAYVIGKIRETYDDQVRHTGEYLKYFEKPESAKGFLKSRKDDLAHGAGAGASRWGSALAKGERVENPTDLVRGLAREFEKSFDAYQEYGMETRIGSSIHTIREMKGVAFAALAAGDAKTAAEALAFTETVDPLSLEETKNLAEAVAKLDVLKKREFLVTLQEKKKESHREFKKEVDTQAKKPIYSR